MQLGNSISGATDSVPNGLTVGTVANASLPAAPNGSMIYCTDCDPALTMSACASIGAKTGAMAFRVNGAWICGG